MICMRNCVIIPTNIDGEHDKHYTCSTSASLHCHCEHISMRALAKLCTASWSRQRCYRPWTLLCSLLWLSHLLWQMLGDHWWQSVVDHQNTYFSNYTWESRHSWATFTDLHDAMTLSRLLLSRQVNFCLFICIIRILRQKMNCPDIGRKESNQYS